MAKQEPSIVIDKLGTHLLQVTNNHTGQVSLKWNWDALLREVQVATGDRQVHYVDVGDLTPREANAVVKKVTKAVKAKKDLVKETETKVSETRAKKVVKDKVTDSVTAKKSTAKKKPAANKSTK